MPLSRTAVVLVAVLWTSLPGLQLAIADEKPPAPPRVKRLLLLGQSPDTHPKMTHEYMAGCQIIARLLEQQPGIQAAVIKADNPWAEGPSLLDGADGAFVFLTEGAKWVCEDSDRLAAFQRLARRAGGLSCLHWGMGTRDAVPISEFTELFGRCHGGTDRKYKVSEFQITLGLKPHAILSGVGPFMVRDELYYDLKTTRSPGPQIDLLQTQIDGVDYPIAWAWERSDKGRSFGFTGLHFHQNWNSIAYRRTVVQGILWSLGETTPPEGLELKVTEADLALPAVSQK